MKLKKQQWQQQQEFHITRSYRPALLAPVFCCHSNHDHPHGPVRKIKKTTLQIHCYICNFNRKPRGRAS